MTSYPSPSAKLILPVISQSQGDQSLLIFFKNHSRFHIEKAAAFWYKFVPRPESTRDKNLIPFFSVYGFTKLLSRAYCKEGCKSILPTFSSNKPKQVSKTSMSTGRDIIKSSNPKT